MKKAKLFPLASFLSLGMLLAACGGKPATSSAPSESKKEEKEQTVQVFLMAGQSNMEGNSYWDNGHKWLETALTDLEIEDGEVFATKESEGIKAVKTSYYGNGYGEITSQQHASNKTDPIKGKFEYTKVGMGHTDDMFGPELGAAYAISKSEKADEENPVYFIKCASGGSGFAQSFSSDPKLNWDVTEEGIASGNDALYRLHFQKYVQNNLDLIEEETGIKPTIKGFMWHQGCSDTATEKVAAYHDRMNALIDRVKTDFADYAPEGDKDNIAFIDAYIYDGPNIPSSLGSETNVNNLNNVKETISKEADNHYIVNSSWVKEGGLKLNIATSGWGDVEGANGTLHYKAKDMFQLGMAYGQIIAENLLD